MPTVHVNLFDTRVTQNQKRNLVRSLTEVVSEVLGYESDTVTIVFRRASKRDVARGGRLGG